MVDQKLLQMQLETMQSMRMLLLDKAFMVKQGHEMRYICLLDLLLAPVTDLPVFFVFSFL